MSNNPLLSGVRPILSLRHSSGEKLILARLTSLGAVSQSNRFVLRRNDLRPPWPQPEKGYFGYAEVARALDANGWRGCVIDVMPSSDIDEARARALAKRKLHMRCVEAAIQRSGDGLGDGG